MEFADYPYQELRPIIHEPEAESQYSLHTSESFKTFTNDNSDAYTEQYTPSFSMHNQQVDNPQQSSGRRASVEIPLTPISNNYRINDQTPLNCPSNNSYTLFKPGTIEYIDYWNNSIHQSITSTQLTIASGVNNSDQSLILDEQQPIDYNKNELKSTVLNNQDQESMHNKQVPIVSRNNKTNDYSTFSIKMEPETLHLGSPMISTHESELMPHFPPPIAMSKKTEPYIYYREPSIMRYNEELSFEFEREDEQLMVEEELRIEAELEVKKELKVKENKVVDKQFSDSDSELSSPVGYLNQQLLFDLQTKTYFLCKEEDVEMKIMNQRFILPKIEKNSEIFSKRSRRGCLTCRQRKKRCCETKPKCLECDRLNINCRWPIPGFERKNKSKNFNISHDEIYHEIYGVIKVLRGVVDYKIDDH